MSKEGSAGTRLPKRLLDDIVVFELVEGPTVRSQGKGQAIRFLFTPLSPCSTAHRTHTRAPLCVDASMGMHKYVYAGWLNREDCRHALASSPLPPPHVDL